MLKATKKKLWKTIGSLHLKLKMTSEAGINRVEMYNKIIPHNIWLVIAKE